MQIQHTVVMLTMTLALAACSSNEVKTGSAGSTSGGMFGEELSVTASGGKTVWQPSTAKASAGKQANPPKAQLQPARLKAAKGDKTYRGQGTHTRLPDAIATNLRLRGLPEQRLGAYVRPVTGGKPVLTAHADAPRNPASTMKLVTTYAALGVLGPAYRWPTELYINGKVTGDILRGDVIIKGYGDPEFGEKDFRELLQALRSRGIRRIDGNLVVDKSFFNIGFQPPIDKNVTASYNAQPEALLYDERGSCYEFRNLAGKIERICPIPPRNKADLNANLFGGFWKLWVGQMGGHLNGGLQVRPAPSGAKLVKTHYSRPLRDIIMAVNKDSNNVMARQMLLSLGAKQFGAPGTTQKGAAAVGQWLESRGLRFSSLRIENGSGLSRVERITARELGEMLMDAYNSPHRGDFMRSLAVLGVDGTLKRRLKTLAGRGKFKTGTLRDVRALAGYLTAANGKTYVVSLLHNDPKARTKALSAHDALVEWVYYGSRSNFASAQQ